MSSNHRLNLRLTSPFMIRLLSLIRDRGAFRQCPSIHTHDFRWKTLYVTFDGRRFAYPLMISQVERLAENLEKIYIESWTFHILMILWSGKIYFDVFWSFLIYSDLFWFYYLRSTERKGSIRFEWILFGFWQPIHSYSTRQIFPDSISKESEEARSQSPFFTPGIRRIEILHSMVIFSKYSVLGVWYEQYCAQDSHKMSRIWFHHSREPRKRFFLPEEVFFTGRGFFYRWDW